MQNEKLNLKFSIFNFQFSIPRRGLVLFGASLLFLFSCAGPRPRVEGSRSLEGVRTGEREWRGVASWYGVEYHGRPTANGEIYDMHGLTAAHLTLPFGSQIQVTHLENGRTVRVRINDRGPFIEGRIIDLSYGAAQVLEMVAQGVAPVRMELLPPAEGPPGNGDYTVQVGSFVNQENAERLKESLSPRYTPIYLTQRETAAATYHQVRVGQFASREAAEGMAFRLKGEGLPVFVTRVEALPLKEK